MKLNQNIAKQIERITAMESAVWDAYYARDAESRKIHNVRDEIPDDAADWTDGEWNYMAVSSGYYDDTMVQLRALLARRAALLLIGYNIARRGKKLHESTILRRTQKLGDDGEFIRTQMDASYVIPYVVAGKPYLHMELKKYGITLLDLNHFKQIQNIRENCVDLQQYEIKSGRANSATAKIMNNRIKKCDKMAKLFHKSVQQRYMVYATELEKRLQADL